MKKTMLLVIVLIAVAKLGSAQIMAQRSVWVTIKSTNLKCWECRDKLEHYLLTSNRSTLNSGIVKMQFNLVAGEIKIQYSPDRTNVDEIKLVINNAGFDADQELADSIEYKKLPPICKRESDGGGPKPGKPCHIRPMK